MEVHEPSHITRRKDTEVGMAIVHRLGGLLDVEVGLMRWLENKWAVE